MELALRWALAVGPQLAIATLAGAALLLRARNRIKTHRAADVAVLLIGLIAAGQALYLIAVS